jgi:hypothetical protein
MNGFMDGYTRWVTMPMGMRMGKTITMMRGEKKDGTKRFPDMMNKRRQTWRRRC